jgi:hypothetical protein
MSSLELDRTTPLSPPIKNSMINPSIHSISGVFFDSIPTVVASHLNTFTPVGTAMIIVAAVK